MKEIVEILLDKIKELELKLNASERERKLMQDYLLERGIVLTHWTERLTSCLDDKED